MRSKFLTFLILFCLALKPALASELKILEPKSAPISYHIAAAEFQKYYKAVTDVELEIISEPDPSSSMVVIGGDFVNSFTLKALEEDLIAPMNFGAGSDTYCMVSAKDGDKRYLFLAGGSGRSTLYAVYDFSEQQAGCDYLWDGDVIPKAEKSELYNLNVLERPHFEYRGIRYFAHRSLSRFQAEHWGPKEWEQEIDWILKKRLNLFMLRIGWDDVFQKAFPDIVPYPSVDEASPEAVPRSYNDRTSAWPLQYRGELRKHLLKYAFERELMHPEDMGPMTHWYTPTPKAFLDAVNPKFLYETPNGPHTNNPCLAVWDIADDENLENYWKLTQAHIDNYGSPQIFHTIGTAERTLSNDPEKNLEYKLYTYRRLISKLREHYPNAPLLLTTWDLYTWSPKDVEKLLSQLNPNNTILFDLRGDQPLTTDYDFVDWGLVGTLPYVFGIFHAGERESDLRGHYNYIEKRMPAAVNDPMCKGFVFWPETSHSDPLMLEFYTHNSWSPDKLTPEEIIPEMCAKRYGEYAAVMEKAWMACLPLMLKFQELPLYRDTYYHEETNENNVKDYRRRLDSVDAQLAELPTILQRLSEVPYGQGNAFVDRDAIDLARTISGRMFAVEVYRYKIVQDEWKNGRASASDVRKAGDSALRMLKSVRDILTLHDDYSLNATMKQMESAYSPLNPTFAQTLKSDSENEYCRTYILELFDYVFIPEFEGYLKYFNNRVRTKAVTDEQNGYNVCLNDVREAFYEKPLSEMTPLNPRPRTNEEFRKLVGKMNR